MLTALHCCESLFVWNSFQMRHFLYRSCVSIGNICQYFQVNIHLAFVATIIFLADFRFLSQVCVGEMKSKQCKIKSKQMFWSSLKSAFTCKALSNVIAAVFCPQVHEADPVYSCKNCKTATVKNNWSCTQDSSFFLVNHNFPKFCLDQAKCIEKEFLKSRSTAQSQFRVINH